MPQVPDEENALGSGVSANTGSGYSSGSSSQRSGILAPTSTSSALPIRSRATGNAIGLSRPISHHYSAQQSISGAAPVTFSQDSRDIREGSYVLGSLALSDRVPPQAAAAAPSSSTLRKSAHHQPETQFESVTPSSPGGSQVPSALAQQLKANQNHNASPPESAAATPRALSFTLLKSSSLSKSADGDHQAATGQHDNASPSSGKTQKPDSASPTESLREADPDVTRDSEGAPTEDGLLTARPSRASISADEHTPLLLPKPSSVSPQQSRGTSWFGPLSRLTDKLPSLSRHTNTASTSLKKRTSHISRSDILHRIAAPLPYLPSTILGILMNLLDGVSYGLIMFPKTQHFLDFGGISVSMFFISCIVSQLVYSTFSIFKAGNGSMMIEVVPFLHSLVFTIDKEVSSEKVIPTVMAAFALSSVITGLVFFALGALKSGRLLEFFPRHVLCGCIGGIGAFLFITGLQVTARFDESNAPNLNLDTIISFLSMPLLPLWSIPLALAIILRELSKRIHHPLMMPAFFALVTAIFYLVAFFGFRRNLAQLQSAGWIFEMSANDAKEPFYKFWAEFSFRNTDYLALLKTMPTQAALVFFAILHVPLNVPALALSLSEDNVSTDKELLNHGISNLCAGLVGTIPNYLCYTNSVLFYRVGGDTRLSGFMLAAATAAVMLVGPQIIGLLPVMVVGTLIYLLGIDLMKEAMVDTVGKVSAFEYGTILAIMVVMTFVDFVVGVGVGILLACVSFVIISSRRASVRQILSGKSAKSTVRRHPHQARFLEDVGSQIRVIKLQGAIFFGTASGCESTIRTLLDEAQWAAQPIRYMVIDMSRCTSVDYSASEAFLRILGTCHSRQVVLVFCGVTPTSAVGKALRGVGLWPGMQDEARLEVFETLNSALEACENWQLRAIYSKDLEPPDSSGIGEGLTIGVDNIQPPSALQSPSDFGHSPRRAAMFAAAQSNLHQPAQGRTPAQVKLSQPLQLLVSSLSAFGPEITDAPAFFHKVAPYFTRMHVEAGTTLWNVGDQPNSFYVIESGVLRASRDMDQLHYSAVETMLPATVCGMLAFLSHWPRNSRLSVERDAVLWRLDLDTYNLMERELSQDHMDQLRLIWARLVQYQQDLLLNHLATAL